MRAIAVIVAEVFAEVAVEVVVLIVVVVQAVEMVALERCLAIGLYQEYDQVGHACVNEEWRVAQDLFLIQVERIFDFVIENRD